MLTCGLRAISAFKKSARLVGMYLKVPSAWRCVGLLAKVRMAQTFQCAIPWLKAGQPGSIDGDGRRRCLYEARLNAMAEEMLADIEKDTVDFGDNFDGSLREPLVLPSRLPNLLLNGSSGIAVGMATNIPPHNLKELVSALVYLIDHHESMDEVTVEELMKFIPGPDFPTGGIIVGNEGIYQAYGTGRGRIVLRGVATIEEVGTNRHRILITEIPYQVNKSSLIERIAELVRDERIDAISDLRDESDQRGMSIVIELKRGAQPQKVLNHFINSQPCSPWSVCRCWPWCMETRSFIEKGLSVFIDHRVEVVTRRRLMTWKGTRRDHIFQGLLIALRPG